MPAPLTSAIHPTHEPDIPLSSYDSLHMLRMAEEMAHVGHWLIDLAQDKIFWSDQIYRIHGVSKEDYTPELATGIDFYHPDDRLIITTYVEAAMRDGSGFQTTLRIIRPDGNIRHIKTSAKCYVEGGKTAKIFGIFTDVTDEQEVRRKERETAFLLKNIVENSPDAIFVKDPEFRLVEANKAFLAFYPEEKRAGVIGTTTLEEYNEAEREAFLKNDKEAFETGKTEIMETIHFPNGDKRTLATTKIRFEHYDGTPHILGICRDVTEQESLVSNLKRSNDELDDFAYIAAHDLKEPLRGMHNHAQFLLSDHQEELCEDALRRINRIIFLTEHAESMVKSLLYFSRIAHGEEAKKAVMMADVIQPIVNAITPERPDAAITVAPSLPRIICDVTRVTELFRNLITNALKYNENAEKTVEIGCIDIAEGERGSPVFYVKDNGIGIHKRHHKDVFRIFKRLHKPGAYGEGNGAGLTIVKKIIDMHGGNIWLESTPKQGTTFFFTLGQRL